MFDISRAKEIFDRYGGIMRTYQLKEEKIYYADIADLINAGLIEKVRTGYYQWIDPDNLSEVVTITRLFPDGILCMDTALLHYGYSDRTPAQWHIAVSKYSNRTRFRIDYPFIKPYYVAPEILEIGLCEQEIDGNKVKMYDKERVICDCLRYRNKMDKEVFNKAIQGYVSDTSKRIPKLMEYAKPLRCVSLIKNIIEIWI
nr:type IV toxin-antitoxin system AbiEi family antitoxin domain-containing protein [uncultured Ruminococcus sp.]